MLLDRWPDAVDSWFKKEELGEAWGTISPLCSPAQRQGCLELLLTVFPIYLLKLHESEGR